ncbi:MAG: hypothetical protein J5997_07695 [Oscillospiraceae bacterium]|nr:hypothetical protein [Oscillospiraceae bacterium]
MNAAKAKKNPAKVKGAVLIMILAVMTVLIILLAGSIAVVYSAHNRAYVKYTESQGYYTARSILDNFYAELSNADAEVDSAGNDMGKYYSLSGEKYDTLETYDNLGIARSIELDAYKAKVDVREGAGYKEWFVKYCDENKSALGDYINKFDSSSVDYTSATDGHNTALYAKVENYMVNLNRSAISDYSSFDKYYDQFLPVTSVAADMNGDTIVYELSSLDGFGNGTIDTNGDGSPDTAIQVGSLADTGVKKAWVTVQVQERILQMGTGDTYGECFRAAEPHKADHFVAKVTSHVIYNGEEITTSLIWKNVGKVSKSPAANAGVSSLGPIDTTTSFTAIGNATSLSDKYHELTNNSLYSGNIYIQGSFDTGTATPSLMMDEGDAFFVGDILKINTNPPKNDYMCDGALFYAKLAQLWSSGDSFGNSSKRINLITEQFESHSTTKEFYGRIFADKFDVTTNGTEVLLSNVRNNNIAGNVSFTDSNKKINGQVYCNFLGVPSDRVWIEFDEAASVAKFHLNYTPAGVAIPETDSRRIENMMNTSTGSTITVFQGISIINSVIEDHRVKNNASADSVTVYYNGHETHKFPDDSGIIQTYDYFRDAGAAGANAPGTNVKNFPDALTNTVRSNAAPTTNKEYQVQIDWSNVNNTIIKSKTSLKIDLMSYIDYNADKDDGVWTLGGDYKKTFTLPSVEGTQLKLVGTEEYKYELPTHRSLFGNYFYGEISGGVTSGDFPKSFNEDTGAFSMDPSDTSHSFTFDKFIEEHSVQAEAFKAGIDPEGPVDITTVPDFTLLTNAVSVGEGGGDTVNDVTMPTWSRVISDSGYIPANGSDGNVYLIDARTNDIELQLGDGGSNQTYTGTYIVYGNKQVTITVPGNVSGPNNQKVDIGTSGHPFIFMHESIYTGIFKNTVVVGEPVSGKPDSINSGKFLMKSDIPIDWYFSKRIGEAGLHTGGSGVTVLSGYVTAPSVFVNIDTNINGIHRETYYNGKKIPSEGDNDKYTFFGSVFCKKYTGGQHAGVCLIPQKPMVTGVPGDERAYSPSAEYSWSN